MKKFTAICFFLFLAFGFIGCNKEEIGKSRLKKYLGEYNFKVSYSYSYMSSGTSGSGQYDTEGSVRLMTSTDESICENCDSKRTLVFDYDNTLVYATVNSDGEISGERYSANYGKFISWISGSFSTENNFKFSRIGQTSPSHSITYKITGTRL